MGIPAIKITCLLPAYNAAATIEKAIESILQQTYPCFEFLLINDGSTDGTAKILKHYENKESIRIIQLSENQGITHALQLGVHEANGEWIARMDADDWAHPDRFARQVAYLQEHPEVAVVATQVKYQGNAKQNAGYAHHVKWQNELCSHESLWANRFVDAPLAHPSVLFHKETVLKAGNYASGSFPEDYELWLRLFSKGIRFGKVQSPLLNWQDMAGRLSRTHVNYAPDAFYKIKAHYVAKELKAKSRTHVWVWGVGKEVYRKACFLENEGLEIAGFIDVRPHKNHYKGKPVCYYQLISQELKGQFILSYVANRKGRVEITRYLKTHHGEAGRDFYLMA